jgi:integrase
MFLSKRKNGFYYIYFDDIEGKRKAVSTKSKIKKEAIKFLSSFKLNLEEKQNNRVNDILLKEFIWEYLKYSESMHTWKTTSTYKTTFNSLIEIVGNVKLSSITQNILSDFINSKLRNSSVYVARKDLINLKASFNWGKNNNYILTNPANCIKRIIPPQKLPLFFSKEEFSSLLEVIDDEEFKSFVVFAVMTGMRRNEIIYLQWSQIDESRQQVMLDNQVFITKSKKVRVVYLNKIAMEILARKNRTSSFVFTFNDKPFKEDYVTKHFKAYIKKLNVNQKLHLHNLRHTHASWLVQSGVPILNVSVLMGHADLKTTQIYSHLRDSDLKKNTAELINY